MYSLTKLILPASLLYCMGLILKGQTWHLSTSVAAWRNHKPNNLQNPFMWVRGTHLWLSHTCDCHTPASIWSPKREWMPAEQHYRPFWHIFGWHSLHVCQFPFFCEWFSLEGDNVIMHHVRVVWMPGIMSKLHHVSFPDMNPVSSKCWHFLKSLPV